LQRRHSGPAAPLQTMAWGPAQADGPAGVMLHLVGSDLQRPHLTPPCRRQLRDRPRIRHHRCSPGHRHCRHCQRAAAQRTRTKWAACPTGPRQCRPLRHPPHRGRLQQRACGGRWRDRCAARAPPTGRQRC
jgi:hypothetical protein